MLEQKHELNSLWKAQFHLGTVKTLLNLSKTKQTSNLWFKQHRDNQYWLKLKSQNLDTPIEEIPVELCKFNFACLVQNRVLSVQKKKCLIGEGAEIVVGKILPLNGKF